MTPAFATVILDVDSTLCGVEGIDWLAARRGADVADRVTALTTGAMSGERRIADIYRERLELVKPTASEIDELAGRYCETIADGAVEAVRAMRAAGARVILVTAGITAAVAKVAAMVGVPLDDVHAVPVSHTASGDFADFDEAVVTRGKAGVVRRLNPARPILAVGDGMTDAELRPYVDAFAAFTGFVRREAVVERADYVVDSFAQLAPIVVGGRGAR